jgi:hypothetical protein
MKRHVSELELQADASAARAASRAGFDPATFLRYLERTRPSLDPARIAALQKTIRELRPAAYTETGAPRGPRSYETSMLGPSVTGVEETHSVS